MIHTSQITGISASATPEGGAVETGCSGLHYNIGCFII